ncbi:hypothetical protein ACJIZ3_002905 [Penstemon smallii]|uniref:J domain-containing protein n=1 Tax=Penstemon smallii TaxID=265156 RepID=A0ABD3U8W2_9LAMI
MDEFGVLVESIGFRAQGKSAPMAKLKPKPKSHFIPSNTSSFADPSSLPVDELDGIFRSSVSINKTQNLLSDDDIFGGSSNQHGGFDLESVLISSSKNNRTNGGNLNSVGSNGYDDLLGLNSKQGDRVDDDVFGSFGGNSSGKQEKKGSGFEDLIPGFGGASSSPSNNGVHSKTDLFPESNGRASKSRSAVEDDPFLVFESSVSQSDASWPFASPSEQDTGKGSVQVSIDELDDFAMGMGHNDSRTDRMKNKTNKPSASTTFNGFEDVDDLDRLFGGGVKQKSAVRPTSTTQDSQFDIFFHEEKKPEVKRTTTKASSATAGDDFTSMFGDVTTPSGEFQEFEGETDERRRLRLSRHMRMNARVAEALAEKNQRDLQSQHEQEEKRRLAETLDIDIKRWAAGKEGNLRALLSSLQQILWAECGWRPVSLTDMITSDSVKKAYKRAALYIHPDKVQQKGANLEQKYIAEKVFDLLKEAWNKFSAEELR